MAKRCLLVLMLAAVAVGGVFAQEETGSEHRLWVSGEISLFGAGIRGEYMLSDNLSIGVNAYFTTLIFFNEFAFMAVGRYYPWAGNFHAGLGVGFSMQNNIGTLEHPDGWTSTGMIQTVGVGIVPEIGWRIDVGEPGGFFLNPVVQVPITLGSQSGDFIFVGNYTIGFGVGVGFRAALGMGWIF